MAQFVLKDRGNNKHTSAPARDARLAVFSCATASSSSFTVAVAASASPNPLPLLAVATPLIIAAKHNEIAGGKS